MLTDDYTRVTASGLADGDVVQLVEDTTALKDGYTYLHCAAEYSVKEAVRSLAEAADGPVDAKTDDQKTALHLAVYRGHAEVVEDLVGVAADCHAVDRWGRTPLNLAARNGHEAAMRALECSGADVDAANNDGNRPLHLAPTYDHCEAASDLLESGAADGAAAHDGSHPLHFTASTQIFQGLAAEKLLSVGAVPDVPRQDGRRPLSLVGEQKGRLRETLLMAGAVAV
jgi:ankyrin repeat protein